MKGRIEHKRNYGQEGPPSHARMRGYGEDYLIYGNIF